MAQRVKDPALSFTAALFTLDKTWKQPKCPSTEKCIKKMWYIDTMEYLSAIKRNKITTFLATWMDLEITMLTEVSQTMRHQHQMLSLTWNLKKGHNELLCRTDTDSDFKKLRVSKGDRLVGRGICWGFGIEML